MIQYVTYKQLIRDVRLLVEQIPFSIINDLAGVVGIPRSGMFPASLIATNLHLPFADFYSFLVSGFSSFGRRLSRRAGTKILVVDDSAYCGATMETVRACVAGSSQFIFSAVYRSPEKLPALDFFARDVAHPRYFEWNLVNHPDSVNFMFDMDGVICKDPPMYDDGGEGYEKYLIEATPLFLPRYKIQSICSMRIEQWRGVTEEWLQKAGVETNELILTPFSSPQERRARVSNYGNYKGRIYQDSLATLFIESEAYQANEINAESKKPVICITTGQVYQ